MRLALRRHRQPVVSREIAGLEGHVHQTAATVGQLDRKNVLERRPGKATLRERTPAQDEQTAAALGDEVRDHPKLVAREEVAFDVGHDHRVVGVELIAPRGHPARQPARPAGVRLHEERVLAVGVLALARHRIDIESGIGAPRASHESVLETWRAGDDEEMALAPRRAHEHAARVVLRDRLGVIGGNLRGVDRRPGRIRRDREHLVER